MEEKRVKEILGEQLELLAETSKKCNDPKGLFFLTKGMCALADIIDEYDPVQKLIQKERE